MEFILLIIGSGLIILNILAIRKEKESFKNSLNHAKYNVKEFDLEIGKIRKEIAETILDIQKDMGLINKKIDDINKCIKNDNLRNLTNEVYIRKRLQKDSNEIKNLNKKYHNDLKTYIDKRKNNEYINVQKSNKTNYGNEKLYKNSELQKNRGKNKLNKDIKSKNNNIKIEEIKKLINLGMSMEEISEVLDIGKGEVLLIKELYLR